MHPWGAGNQSNRGRPVAHNGPQSPPQLTTRTHTQPPSATSRAEVATLNLQTPLGRLRLDAGDAAQVYLLSDELRMDEIAALMCLVMAQDEVKA